MVLYSNVLCTIHYNFEDDMSSKENFHIPLEPQILLPNHSKSHIHCMGNSLHRPKSWVKQHFSKEIHDLMSLNSHSIVAFHHARISIWSAIGSAHRLANAAAAARTSTGVNKVKCSEGPKEEYGEQNMFHCDSFSIQWLQCGVAKNQRMCIECRLKIKMCKVMEELFL